MDLKTILDYTLPKTNVKMGAPWKRRFLLDTTIFRYHVSFGECKHIISLLKDMASEREMQLLTICLVTALGVQYLELFPTKVKYVPSGKLTAMENGPFEDVFPTENGDFPASHVSLPECTFYMAASFT